MLNKRIKGVIKATVRMIIVAFIYSSIFISISYIIFRKDINNIIEIVNLISVKTNNKILANVSLNIETSNLTNYPQYGSRYATIKIPSLDIDLPVYFGDELEILKLGVGHSSGSYFPGEGGSILYMGHNTTNQLAKLKDIENEAIITIKTTYGTFNYKVYNTKVIDYQDIDEVPINRESEVLMIYTCYQSLTIGHTTKRFVVYAKLESEE